MILANATLSATGTQTAPCTSPYLIPPLGPTILPPATGNISSPRSCEAQGVSSDGSIIVGDDNGEADAFQRACYWTNGVGPTELPFPGGAGAFEPQGKAWACSQDGSIIVGQASGANSAIVYACSWTGGVVTALPHLGTGDSAIATACSDDGSVIVGSSYTVAGVSASEHATSWTGGVATDLGVPFGRTGSLANGCSSDGSIVVGSAEGGAGRLPIVWTSGVASQLPLDAGWTAPTAPFVNGCSGDGSIIVGCAINPAGFQQACYWNNGVFTALGPTPTDANSISAALCVSHDGTVIGGSVASNTESGAVYWVGGVMTRLPADISVVSPAQTTAISTDKHTMIAFGGVFMVAPDAPLAWGCVLH